MWLFPTWLIPNGRAWSRRNRLFPPSSPLCLRGKRRGQQRTGGSSSAPGHFHAGLLRFPKQTPLDLLLMQIPRKKAARRKGALLAAVLLLLPLACGRLVINIPGKPSVTLENAATYPYGLQAYNISAPAVLAPSRNGCVPPEKRSALAGKIVLLVNWAGCSDEEKARVMQRAGAVGVVHVMSRAVPDDYIVGFRTYISDGTGGSSVQLPVEAVVTTAEEVERLTPLLAPGAGATASMRNSDNKWDPVMRGPAQTVLSIIVCVLCSIITVVSFIKWRLFVLAEKGMRLSIAQTCLALQTFASLVRALFFALDPFFSARRIPFSIGRFMLTISQPLSFVTALLLVFYWNEILDPSSGTGSRTGLFAKRSTKIATAVLCSIIILVDFLTSLDNALYNIVELEFYIIGVAASLVALVQLIIAVGFIVMGSRVVKALGKGTAMSTNAQRERARKQRMVRHFLASSLFMVLFAILAGIVLFVPFFQPVVFLVMVYLIFLSTLGYSWFVISIFVPPQWRDIRRPSQRISIAMKTFKNPAHGLRRSDGGYTRPSMRSSTSASASSERPARSSV
eukprot:PLAT2197.1.p1 GENE.PLAT2197.1~~PLAT2197.1.p1  ORF type:complete len:565 (+),score=196.82 PLAT2197.1:617-2311(+)